MEYFSGEEQSGLRQFGLKDFLPLAAFCCCGNVHHTPPLSRNRDRLPAGVCVPALSNTYDIKHRNHNRGSGNSKEHRLLHQHHHYHTVDLLYESLYLDQDNKAGAVILTGIR